MEDFKRVNVSFQDGIKPFARKVDVIKLIGKNQIVDYQIRLLFATDKDINKALFEKIYGQKN